MKRPSLRRAMVGSVPFTIALAAAAPAVAPQLAGLAQIEPGEWQLKESGATGRGRMLCVADPAVLLELGHPGAHCPHFVIADASDGTTVHYTCPGNGHGRTAISVETPRLFRLQTQGIAGGAPFDYDYEARRVGACTPTTH